MRYWVSNRDCDSLLNSNSNSNGDDFQQAGVVIPKATRIDYPSSSRVAWFLKLFKSCVNPLSLVPCKIERIRNDPPLVSTLIRIKHVNGEMSVRLALLRLEYSEDGTKVPQ